MKLSASALPLALLMAAVPLAAPLQAQAARDFQLPPAPAPSTDTRVQGPVDTDAPVPVRPRAIETARPETPAPTPTAATTRATPVPAASATPVITLPDPTAARRAATRTAVPPTLPAQATPTVAPALEPVQGPTATTQLPPAVAAPTASPAATLPAASPAGEQPEAAFPWLWLVLGGLALAGIAAAALMRARRGRANIEAPAIVAPPAPLRHEADAEGLAIKVEATRMDRSVLNATVGYRVTIRNRTSRALNGVAVEADLVSASANRSTEQQLALPGQSLTPRHAVERLGPGQSLRFEGQVRLPLSEAAVIRQGRVGLLVPLLRVRATSTDCAPVATTLVLGRAEGSTARPQPFRLDEPPRSYAPLAQRVLDGVAAQA